MLWDGLLKPLVPPALICGVTPRGSFGATLLRRDAISNLASSIFTPGLKVAVMVPLPLPVTEDISLIPGRVDITPSSLEVTSASITLAEAPLHEYVTVRVLPFSVGLYCRLTRGNTPAPAITRTTKTSITEKDGTLIFLSFYKCYNRIPE